VNTMDKLNALYELAAENEIEIVCKSFSGTKKAACLHLKPNKYVILDKPAMSSMSEEGAVLSEEIGHYETGGLYVIESTYNSPISRSNRIKYEASARHWAYRQMLPPHEIEEAYMLEGLHDDFAMAEFCQVTIEFFRKAIEYHRSCGIVFSFDNVEDCT